MPEQDQEIDYRKAFLRCKRALNHLMHKTHKLRPVKCDGCREVALFLTEPGYLGDEAYPVGVELAPFT